MNWNRFIPIEFEYDEKKDKLSEHGVTFDEVIQCFFNDFTVMRNKRFKDRWQLVGITDGGRKLKIIFQLKSKRVVRIITGWPI
ncbi:MAG: BrnT family toxin [bacterium]